MTHDQGTARRSSSAASAADPAHRPWYRIPAMYLVIGGPATVVVAGIATAVIAYRGADRPLLEHVSSAESTQPHAPAMAGRNHAATPRP